MIRDWRSRIRQRRRVREAVACAELLLIDVMASTEKPMDLRLRAAEMLIRSRREVPEVVGAAVSLIREPEPITNAGRGRAAVLSSDLEKARRLANAYAPLYEGIRAYGSPDAIRGSQWEVVIVDHGSWTDDHRIRTEAELAARIGPRPRVLIEVDPVLVRS